MKKVTKEEFIKKIVSQKVEDKNIFKWGTKAKESKALRW